MRRPPDADGRAVIAHALALGALHGPAELLPVSSSGHVTLVPWLLGWEYAELPGDVRKAFEVALHAGTAAALLVGLRGEVGEALGALDLRGAALLVLGTAPAAATGFVLERPIEARLGTPGTIAAGLALGAAAMAGADARGGRTRSRDEAGPRDALALGLAQATALVPGVSRGGATLAAGRALGFARRDASVLSRHLALPIIAGATALKAVRLARGGLPAGAAAPLAAGAAAAFASTLLSTRLVRDDRPLAPLAAYRLVLAAVVLRRLWQDRRA